MGQTAKTKPEKRSGATAPSTASPDEIARFTAMAEARPGEKDLFILKEKSGIVSCGKLRPDSNKSELF